MQERGNLTTWMILAWPGPYRRVHGFVGKLKDKIIRLWRLAFLGSLVQKLQLRRVFARYEDG